VRPITEEEHERISDLHHAGVPVKRIARIMGRQNCSMRNSSAGQAVFVPGPGWSTTGVSASLISSPPPRTARDGTIDEATHRARLAERWKYLISRKERPDDQGHVRVRYPASSPNPTVRCELKPSPNPPPGVDHESP
jgi:hypothetical protein